MKQPLPIEECGKADHFETETDKAFREFGEAWSEFCKVFWSETPFRQFRAIIERLLDFLQRTIGE